VAQATACLLCKLEALSSKFSVLPPNKRKSFNNFCLLHGVVLKKMDYENLETPQATNVINFF
jgi:hypothetical protein